MKANHYKIVFKIEFKIIFTFNKKNYKKSYLKIRKQKTEMKCMLMFYKFNRKIKIYKTNLKIKIEAIFLGTKQSNSLTIFISNFQKQTRMTCNSV